jgi:hypothetical protein
LAEGAADSQAGTALDAPARTLPASTSLGESPPHADSQPAAEGTSAPTARSTVRSPTCPEWVNRAELIGPCGHEAFAAGGDPPGRQPAVVIYLFRRCRPCHHHGRPGQRLGGTPAPRQSLAAGHRHRVHSQPAAGDADRRQAVYGRLVHPPSGMYGGGLVQRDLIFDHRRTLDSTTFRPAAARGLSWPSFPL